VPRDNVTSLSKRLSDNYRCAEIAFPSGYVFDANVSRRLGVLKHLMGAGRLECGNQPSAFVPADVAQMVDDLRCERYTADWRHGEPLSSLAKLYYLLRPLLPVSVRRHLQRIHLRGWENLQFPAWPLDSSVDELLEDALLAAMQASGVSQVPFIWFWPEGASSCATMTHDVESKRGRDFCGSLMRLDNSFGIKASFQLIPEGRYEIDKELLRTICDEGFEVVIHDLNHDGHLYMNRSEFRKRAQRINAYGKKYHAEGFRAGVLYRKQLWYEDLDFSYDMSVPNVAHLDPQHGGCCTVMPYFIGDILELPVTTTQDYTLFNILNDYSTDLWRQQVRLLMKKHGLMSFIIHPDYIMGRREEAVYVELLEHLRQLKTTERVWIALPGEVNQWWRQRAKMTLVAEEDGWRINGEGSERARVAYAKIKNGRLVLSEPGGAVDRSVAINTVAPVC